MFHSFFQPGCAYRFHYPRHNYRHVPVATEVRRILVESVRDTLYEPIESMTISLNPFLQRGRWLITGTDLDKADRRSFYVEAMNEIQPLTRDDLQPLKGAEYVVIEQTHVTYKTTKLGDALQFRHERHSGTICAVLYHEPREIDLTQTDDPPFAFDF
ncbi:SH3 domain-containing protein [Schlesneria paludicola]|uniref:hypothetical protein n=1 Tax=Schlesneria paludicola TaxID=360056 RepID=UPI00029A73AC|nr:hypothetical protein [Schlesneria paludicola]